MRLAPAATAVLIALLLLTVVWSVTHWSGRMDGGDERSVIFSSVDGRLGPSRSGRESFVLEPGEEIIQALSFRLAPTAPPGESLGTVSVFPSADSRYRCGAGFVNSSHTRIPANQNDIEFWCGSNEGTSKPLKFRSLGRPRPDQLRTHIANLNGYLFDYESLKYYDRERSGWMPLPDRDQQALGGSRPLLVQRLNGATFVAALNYQDCGGVSIFSEDGYHGTVGTSNLVSAILFHDGRVLVNLDHLVLEAVIPEAQAGEDCVHLEARTRVGDRNWIYVFFPYDGAVYFGGSVVGSDRTECANVYRMAGSDVVSVAPDGDCSGDITEYYCHVVFRDHLLIGNFRDGNLTRVLDPLEIQDSGMPGFLKDDFISPVGKRYRESQSSTIACGDLFVGMYPWGELFRIGDHGTRVQRVFGAPPKVKAQPAPYYGEAVQFARTHPDLDVYQVEEGFLGVLSRRDGFDARSRNTLPVSWAQRITTLAVLNGEICLGTGNMSGGRFDPELHPYIPEASLAEYGTVLCAALENHTLGSFDHKDSTTLKFLITTRHLVILQDDLLVSMNEHNLTRDALSALSELGPLEIGNGVYGKFRGRVTRSASELPP